LKEMKNKILADGMTSKESNKDRILAHEPVDKQEKSLKNKEEAERNTIRKRERKSLMKSLQMA